MTPKFELTKWYADCISEQGDAAIIYHARLRWRAVTICYESLLICRAKSPTLTRFSMRRRQAPKVLGERIEWISPEWKVKGTWDELGVRHQNMLFESDAGALEWNCLAPRARAAIIVGSELAIEGWGYVEHLRLTVAPWKLPIRRLRWGRFINATDALVWIDWDGPQKVRVVYLNGVAVAVDNIGDDKIVLADGPAVLSVHNKQVVRNGRLGATALSPIPRLKRLFPESVLNIQECKWLSHVVLCRPGSPNSLGMAIHEVVTWP